MPAGGTRARLGRRRLVGRRSSPASPGAGTVTAVCAPALAGRGYSDSRVRSRSRSYSANASSRRCTSERREQALVLLYEKHLNACGSDVTRHRIQPPGESKPLLTDLYDKTRNNLIEAKGTGTRGAIRMAIGQLADYSRFLRPPEGRQYACRASCGSLVVLVEEATKAVTAANVTG